MPTKPNSAGEQQNYVPSGNGDASGEYGDKATGSNKHFANFKAPEPIKKDFAQQSQEQTEQMLNTASNQEKISYAKEFEKKSIEVSGRFFGKREQNRLLKELEDGVGNFTDEKLLEIFEQNKNTILMIKQKEKYQELLDNAPKIYFQNKGKFYIVKDPSKILEGSVIYNNRDEFVEASRKHTDEIISKKQEKAISYKQTQTEIDFINKTNYKGNLALEGISDSNKKEILDATEKVFEDFPILKSKLVALGNKKGLERQATTKLSQFQQTQEYQNELNEFVNKYTSTDSLQKYGQVYYTKEGATHAFNERLLQKFGKPISTYQRSSTVGYSMPMGNDESYVVLNNMTRSTIEHSGKRNEDGERGNVALSFKGVAAHELGHSIANTIFQSGGVMSYYSYDRNIHEQLVKLCEGHNVQKEISTYARTNDAELIAESFCSHYEQENNPLAEKIYSYVKDLYDKKWGK